MMKKNILFIIDSLRIGGKEKQLYFLVGEVSKKYNVYIITFNKQIEYDFSFENTRIIINDNDRKSIGFILFLNKFIREKEISLIHTFDLISSLATIIPCKINNVIHINGNIRGSIKHNLFSKSNLLYELSFLFSDCVIANSHAGLSSKRKKQNNKYKTIHNGFHLINKNIINDSDVNKNSNHIFRIGMVANIREGKDFNLLIDASKELIKTIPMKIYIIGSGPDINLLKEKVKGYEDSFVFTDKILNPSSFIKLLDVCLMLSKMTPSHGEGISNSILEYYSFHKPVIATNSGGNNEIVEDGYNGFIIREGDLQELILKIKILYSDIKLRTTFGNNGFRKILNEFSLEKMVNNYLMMYKTYINKK